MEELNRREEELKRVAIMVGIFLETRRKMERKVKELEEEILDLYRTYQDPDRGELPAWIENKITTREEIIKTIKKMYYL